MNAGSKRIATEYQRSTNTLRAQNPERQKIQANAKKERSDLVKCIQNPTKCVSKVNSVQEPCAKCFAVHILKFEIYSYHMKKKQKNWKLQVWCSLFHFFHVICKISNLICEPKSIWHKLLVLSWLYTQSLLLRNHQLIFWIRKGKPLNFLLIRNEKI